MSMEVERNDYASKGVAGAGLGLGIAGTALGLLNGGLGGIFGGVPAAAAAVPAAMAFSGNCSQNMPVNRYEMDQQKELIDAQAEIAYLRGRDASKTDDLAMYQYIDGQLKEIRSSLATQAVHNQRTEDSFALVRQDVQCVRNDLTRQIEMEAERRCCGDNSIVTYANATFYPKMVADVTTGTTTTAQTLYNPLPKCGCCNG